MLLSVLIVIIPLAFGYIVTDEEYASMPELFYLDNYDHCFMTSKEALYCTITVQLAPLKTNYSEVWEIIKVVTSTKKNFRHDVLRHSICVSRTCPKIIKNISLYINNTDYLTEEISTCYSQKYSSIGLYGNVTELFCQTREPLYNIDVYDVVFGVFLFFLAAIVVLCSTYEGLARYKSQEEYLKITNSICGRIITCFAIAKNWERLKTVPDNEDVASLYGINGIRFYTIFLVVAVHSCMVSFTTYSTNPEFVETMTGDPLNMIFVNGYYCIQTFFLLSGMVLSYFFFKTLQKQKTFKISYIFYAFLIRYVRLTTSVIVVVAFSASWLRHLNRGPLWDKTVGTEFRNCRRNWWANLLYINNYYDIPHMCLLQSWYLAADSQLFFLSLIILIIVSKFKKFLVHILSLCMVIGVIIPGIITYVNSYDIVIRQYPETLYELYANAIEWHAVYVSAHTNIGSYVMGLIAGYIIFKYRGKSIVLQKRYIILWWILVWVLPLSIIFLGIPIYRDSFEYSRLGAAVYVALSKNVFVFGICVGILGITKGIGWLLRDAVLWSPLQILGRLTYCLYLVHPTFIRIKAGRNRVKTYMTPFTFLMDTVENLLLSYALALVLCLFVEMPTSALQKLMMSKGKQNHFITEKMPTATTVKTEDTKI